MPARKRSYEPDCRRPRIPCSWAPARTPQEPIVNRTRPERQIVSQTDPWRSIEFIYHFHCSDEDIQALEGLRAPDPLSLFALWAPATPPVLDAGAFAQSRRGAGVDLDPRAAIDSSPSRLFTSCSAASALSACLPAALATRVPDEHRPETRPVPPEHPEYRAATSRVAPTGSSGNVNHSPRYS